MSNINWNDKYFVHNQHGEYIHNFKTLEEATDYLKIFNCPENYTVSFLSSNDTFRQIERD